MDDQAFAAFRARFEAQGKDPEAVTRMLVEGMLALEQDPGLGSQMMALVTSKKNLEIDPDAPAGVRFRHTDDSVRRLLANPNIARSYAGGDHRSGYGGFAPDRIALDRGYSADRQGIDYPAAGQAKFFVRCGGADTPRPVTLARNDAGYWKVTNFSSLTVGVRPPAGGGGGDF
jgi:hypothetical protein